jgi:hypothetical protein
MGDRGLGNGLSQTKSPNKTKLNEPIENVATRFALTLPIVLHLFSSLALAILLQATSVMRGKHNPLKNSLHFYIVFEDIRHTKMLHKP